MNPFFIERQKLQCEIMIYKVTKEFEKDLKRLIKKYSSLEQDLETLKKYGIDLFHENINANAIVKIEGMCQPPYIAYKVRKIACRSLKNRGNQSGLRLIYIFDEMKKIITLVELYAKSEKGVEDKGRLKREIEFLKKLGNSSSVICPPDGEV